MGVAIGILATLLVVAAAIIFLLAKVFFSTLGKFEEILNLSDSIMNKENFEGLRNYEMEKAYDGKYYPCKTLFLKIKFEQEDPIFVADFSLYDSQQCAGLEIYTDNTLDYYVQHSKEWAEYKEIHEGQEIEKTAILILRNVILYSPMEGVWAWKYQ